MGRRSTIIYIICAVTVSNILGSFVSGFLHNNLSPQKKQVSFSSKDINLFKTTKTGSCRSYSTIQSVRYMANETETETVPSEKNSSSDDDDDDNNSLQQNNNPLVGLKENFDSFAASGSYRTILFCGAFLGSPNVREFIGIPGCLGVVALTWAIYTYNTRFDNLVDIVTPKRQKALRQLREAKAAQLSSNNKNKNNNNNVSIQDLAAAYEETLREELATRVIIPGIWVIEMDPTQEDRSAAPQFLGLEITENHTLEPIKKR